MSCRMWSGAGRPARDSDRASTCVRRLMAIVRGDARASARIHARICANPRGHGDDDRPLTGYASRRDQDRLVSAVPGRGSSSTKAPGMSCTGSSPSASRLTSQRSSPVWTGSSSTRHAWACGVPGVGHRQRLRVGRSRGGDRAPSCRARLHRRDGRARRGHVRRPPWREVRGRDDVAILPGEDRVAANEWADHVVVTGIGHARNLAVAASGDAVIAVGGSWGTLAELAFARRLGRRVVALDGAPEVEGIEVATTPEDAVRLALRDLE